ncbi:uncharacterized protein VICG_00602 [Vittaforma corneae ATCC 50505]|uniref:Actin-related protein 5 n=1 Tax=Vittaforma corneae (strain ATCC 50505) TaxID=993615 RepID=L2GNN0_VITCO|nr:uncharacterized protein VICG_00602 [Vittaforma corneae ATCC 50505]ELA42503.1 hypothetical protein VICG_00602 [Vittaforma corneae ATCC 50505]
MTKTVKKMTINEKKEAVSGEKDTQDRSSIAENTNSTEILDSNGKINTSEKHYPNIYFKPRSQSNTIVMDNGTFELKAGYLNDLCIIARNRLFKSKDKVSLEPFPSSTVRSMFDGDVIINFDVLEQTIDLIFEYMKPSFIENLIFTSTPYSPTEQELIDFLFETYKFNKIQIGYDFIYLYHKYFDKKDCVVVDFKYSSIIVCVIKGYQIFDIYKINFGGKDMLEYINYTMIDKYRESRKDYKGLVEYLRVSDNYDSEALSIYHDMCSGIYDRNIFLTESTVQKIEPAIKKMKKVDIKSTGQIPVVDYSLLDIPDESLSKEQLKEKRRMKMLFCGTLSRLKTKVEKLFIELDESIGSLEDELEKQSNLKKYISKKKAKFDKLKRELELRDQLRREARNRKSREFSIKFKEGQLTEEEQLLKYQIIDAEDEEQENAIISNVEKLALEITELDPEFIPFYANTVEILRGDNLGRQCVNVELLKWPEIMFDPSIIGSEQMGLSEIFENIFPQTQIENVLICGGFSFIRNLENRIINEVRTYLHSGNVNLIKIKDSQKEPFYNCQFSDMFPIYTREAYERSKKVDYTIE